MIESSSSPLLEQSSCVFSDHQVKSYLKQKRALGTFVNSLLLQYRKKASMIGYTFVCDEDLLEMNRSHLNHDTYTDIITFDLSEKKSEVIIGDIYISVDRVRDNAKQFGVSYQHELLRVILHGALHIAGFGDKSKQQKLEMRSLEELWMNRFLNH